LKFNLENKLKKCSLSLDNRSQRWYLRPAAKFATGFLGDDRFFAKNKTNTEKNLKH